MPDFTYCFRCCALLFTLIWARPATAQYYYYFPNSVHIPVLEHALDATLGGRMGRGTGFQSYEGQLSFSPVRYVGMMGNYAQAGGKAVKELRETGGSMRFWEAGLGAYQPIGKSCASLFGGYGEGEVFNSYGNDLYSRFLIERWFVQPALMYQDNYFTAGMAIRFNYLVYSKGETAYNTSADQLLAIRSIEDKSPFFLPELGFQVGMDFSPFSLHLALGNIFSRTEHYNFSRFNSQIGITLDIGDLVWLKRNKK